jgi:hypothetical protein
MEHKSAKAEVLERYPGARVVRGVFGLVVETDEDGGRPLGEGRAYFEEEAWLSALAADEWRRAQERAQNARRV